MGSACPALRQCPDSSWFALVAQTWFSGMGGEHPACPPARAPGRRRGLVPPRSLAAPTGNQPWLVVSLSIPLRLSY